MPALTAAWKQVFLRMIKPPKQRALIKAFVKISAYILFVVHLKTLCH